MRNLASLSVALFGLGISARAGAQQPAPAQQQPQTQAQAPQPPAVNPGRPTVTDVAGLTVPGYIEVESGLIYEHGAGLNYLYSGSALFKLTDRTARNEFRVFTNGYIFQQPMGGRATNGLSDTTLGFQHLYQNQGPHSYDMSFRLETKLPTAPDNIGTGRTDYNLLLLFSKDYSDKFHGDYNLGQAFLGNPNGNGYIPQGFASASFSYKVTSTWTAQSEIYGFSGNELNPTNVSNGYAVSYTPDPAHEFDAYVGFGLSAGAPKYYVTVGYTFFLGKVF